MGIASLPGLKEIATQLLWQISRQRLSHAYLFTGTQQEEMLQMARAFTKALNCLAPTVDGDSCDQCSRCRRIEHGNNPDFLVIEPEGGNIKIGQIRQLQQQLAKRSLENGRKVYVLVGAEQMNEQAANSLLKTIEEPPSPSVGILLANHREQLMSTVVSRCQEVIFPSPSPHMIQRRLVEKGIQTSHARILSFLTDDQEQAETMVEEGFAEALNLVIQWGKEVIQHPVAATVTLQTLFRSGYDNWILGVLILWLRDVLHCQLQLENHLAFESYRSQLAEQAALWPQDKLLLLLEQLFTLQRRKRVHVNLQLAVEELVFSSFEEVRE